MIFKWDPRKAALNLKKHRVSFEEALTVFEDPQAQIFDDETHSNGELREIMVGHSQKSRILMVCFAERDETVRIFSARKATKRERRDYEESFKD